MNSENNIPTEDDWGVPTTDTPPSDLGSSQDDDWDDWDTNSSDNASDDWGTDNNSSDDWDDWDTEGSTSDTWNDDEVNIPQEPEGTFIDNNETFDDFENESPVIETSPVNFNMSTKKVAFIIAGVIIFLACIVMFFDSIHIKKINPQPNTQQEVNSQQSNNEEQPSPSDNNEPATQDNTKTDGVSLIEVPNDMSLNYSGDVLETNGSVVKKKKYLQGNQVLYCITINLAAGLSNEEINYYCNYASFNTVSQGDIVVVQYQQVEDNYISINSISK